MTDEPPGAPTATIEALRDLLQHPGWAIYRGLVMDEIAADFEEHITRALDVPDPSVAIDRMRQVAAVRKAGLRWLKLPKERLDSLLKQQQTDKAVAVQGRRPLGL